MAFDRHQILVDHYTASLSSLDFDKIKADAKTNCSFEFDSKAVIARYWLGTVLGVMPSGKVYAAWTTNQTNADVAKDQAFTEALENLANSHGMFMDWQDESIFLSMLVDYSDDLIFVDSDEADEAKDFLITL